MRPHFLNRNRTLVLAALCLVLAGMAPPASAAATTDTSSFSPNLTELSAFGEHARTYRMMLVIFQIASILAATKLLGWLCEKIKVPGVIGELLAGAIIGPFLLGSVLSIPIHGHWVPLFPKPLSPHDWPVNDVIWSIAQFASIVLLFITGLHTDLKQFLRYVGPATFIALLGLVVPFALGAGVVYIPFFSDIARHDPGQSVLVPALFVGAILAATSIGITARVLGDIGKLDTPEGVTIIGAAVLDDVLGIIALAIVGGIATAGTVSTGAISLIAFKAIGFWLGLTVLILFLAKPIERFIGHVKYSGALVGLALALAFICSGAAEGFGLAFIIGAYSVGLGLSQTRMAHRLMDELRPISDFMVPIFFAALGMLVNFNSMLADWKIIVFGLVISAVAIFGKLFGCGIAAYATGFNTVGSYRIGVGMMPRGEVALIVAGIGLSRQLIQENVFGVSIMMTLITTIVAPILLVPAFARGGSGRKGEEERSSRLPASSKAPPMVFPVSPDLGKLLLTRLLAITRENGWHATLDNAETQTYVLRNGPSAVQIGISGTAIRIESTEVCQHEFMAALDAARKSLLEDLSHAPNAGIETKFVV